MHLQYQTGKFNMDHACPPMTLDSAMGSHEVMGQSWGHGGPSEAMHCPDQSCLNVLVVIELIIFNFQDNLISNANFNDEKTMQDFIFFFNSTKILYEWYTNIFSNRLKEAYEHFSKHGKLKASQQKLFIDAFKLYVNLYFNI